MLTATAHSVLLVMAIITTHPGGPYYEWRVQTMGSPPPYQFNEYESCEGVLYHDWQHGVPHSVAKDQFLACLWAGPPGPPPPGPPPDVHQGPPPPTPEPPAPEPAPQPPITEGPIQTGGPSHPTVYGVPYDAERFRIMDTILGVGTNLKASRLLLEAITYAAMGESTVSAEVNNGGPLQTTCNYSAYNHGRDIAGQARAWFLGGECFSSGGGFHYEHIYNTPWQIANAVEENAVWSQRRGDSYERGGYTTAMLEAEAANTVSYLLPGLPPGGVPTQTVTAPSSGGVFDTFRELNWAGDFINAWKFVEGGANEAAAMSDRFRTDRIDKLTVIGWE